MIVPGYHEKIGLLLLDGSKKDYIRNTRAPLGQ